MKCQKKNFKKSSIINILKHINENEDEYEDENKDIPHTNVLVMGTLSKVFKQLESETLPVEEYDFEEEEMKYRIASNIYMEEEALPQERYMISEQRMGRTEMEERLSRPENGRKNG